MAAPSCEPPTEPRAEADAVEWLALLLRQACLLLAAGVERRYPRLRQRHICDVCGQRYGGR
jgi:hypothetical protein